jgi:hypothetical protein
MASVDPGTVYFPEPNFIVQITPETIQVSFGNPKMESRRLAQNAARKLRTQKPLYLWDPAAALVTTAPTRMEIGSGESMMRQWEQVRPFTSADLQALFRTSQNHARRRTWINQVANSYGLPGNPALKVLTRMYTVCFPVDSDDATSFEPVGALAQRLASWQVDDAALAALRAELEPHVEARQKATGDTSGDASTIAQRITDVAVAAGQGVSTWLQQLLAGIDQALGS